MSDAIVQNKFTESKAFAVMQRLGKSFMLPIASLPVAALLMRLGQPDMLGADGLNWGVVADVIGAAGTALFDNLPLLFAVGVAVGFAKKSDGSTAMAAVVGYLVYQNVLKVLSPIVLAGQKDNKGEQLLINYNVLGGIIIGIVAALLWQKYYRIKLPPYLAFFGGRRFVPMVTAFAAIIIACLMAWPYPAFNNGLNAFSDWITKNSVLGGFVFGFTNRILLTFGLHHLLNNVPWFQLGSYNPPNGGATAHGDIARFLAGDPTAGTFLTGFFPIMMFALPAAAIAIWHSADKENRKAIGGMMTAVALTAFITGVTEPLEFAFMFVAYPLYLFHAVMTGVALALCNALGIRDGFGFSAGAIDYLLNFRIANQPILLLGIGLIYAAIYYVVFRWAIKKFDFATPGRTTRKQKAAAEAELEKAGLLGKDTDKSTDDADPNKTAEFIKDEAAADNAIGVDSSDENSTGVNELTDDPIALKAEEAANSTAAKQGSASGAKGTAAEILERAKAAKGGADSN